MNITYYEYQLKLVWSESKRPNIYESIIFHGFNCPPSCCSRTRVTDERNGKGGNLRNESEANYQNKKIKLRRNTSNTNTTATTTRPKILEQGTAPMGHAAGFLGANPVPYDDVTDHMIKESVRATVAARYWRSVKNEH